MGRVEWIRNVVKSGVDQKLCEVRSEVDQKPCEGKSGADQKPLTWEDGHRRPH